MIGPFKSHFRLCIYVLLLPCQYGGITVQNFESAELNSNNHNHLLYIFVAIGEYGWLVKATASTEPDNDADTLPTHQPVLVKMITGLGLGWLPWCTMGLP